VTLPDRLDRIKDLYAAHDEPAAAWPDAPPAPPGTAAAAARPAEAYAAWTPRSPAIDEARKNQMAAPGLQEPAKKALATLDREWEGLAAHRSYPMISLDNNTAERTIRGPSSPGRTPAAPTTRTPPGSPP
jgi:hypothetical protein